MPMVRRGNRNRIDILVVEQLANVYVGLRFGNAHLLGVGASLAQNVLVDVAEIGDFDTGDWLVASDVIPTAAADTDHRDTDAVICAQHFPGRGSRDEAGRCGFQEIAPVWSMYVVLHIF